MVKYRGSRSPVFLEKGVLKKCSKFTGEHPCRSAISIKLQSSFIEITLRHGCSPVNLLHVFRATFLKNTSGWLLLAKWKPKKVEDIIAIYERVNAVFWRDLSLDSGQNPCLVPTRTFWQKFIIQGSLIWFWGQCILSNYSKHRKKIGGR